MKKASENFSLGGQEFQSRLFVGTGKFESGEILSSVIELSQTQLVTVALKRFNLSSEEKDSILPHITKPNVQILPNTSGVRDAKEAVFAAKMAREALETNFLKLEIHPDPKYLMPDPLETLYATEELAQNGFIVLPYCHADPVLCKRLESAGAAAVMPLGSTIGSNRGLDSREFLRIIIEQANLPVIIDAGIGKPSQAADAMEMGADAVLVNTALAVSPDPGRIAVAFKDAVKAGRTAYLAGMGNVSNVAQPSSPLTEFLG
jgi:thiazole synthase